MKDERTLAFINFHAILGALTELCRLVKGAAKLIAGEKVAVGISVKDGPCGTLFFNDGKCTVGEGTAEADIKAAVLFLREVQRYDKRDGHSDTFKGLYEDRISDEAVHPSYRYADKVSPRDGQRSCRPGFYADKHVSYLLRRYGGHIADRGTTTR